MTDEEADALDEYYTKNPPKVDPSKNGGFAKKSFRMVALDTEKKSKKADGTSTVCSIIT